MNQYIHLIMLFGFLINFLLLLGTDRLSGYPPSLGRTLLAALLGGIYGGACVLQDFYFLGNILWRFVSLALMSMLAFGMSISALRRGVIFTVLAMALGGIVRCIGSESLWSVLIGAAALLILCRIGFHGKPGHRTYVPVELQYGGKSLQLTALMDTGNTLTDPITGGSVLVVGADTAQSLLGLTVQQLKAPLENVGQLPGLRLIPFRAVGQEAGLLLALRLKDVKIGNWKGNSLVAFAPQTLSQEGAYQALTGGNI